MTAMPELRDRFVGSLLGATCGDVLGAAVEMWSRDEIRATFGLLRDFQPHTRGFGRYTDDTEMSLALTRSLCACGGADAGDCARRYAATFTPGRGYGRSAVQILSALGEGREYWQTATLLFPEGSYGNGAAMRIAPVGLLYGRGTEAGLREAVDAAVCCTHVHLEAVEAACLQAVAVGLLLEGSPGRDFTVDDLLGPLQRSCRCPMLGRALTSVAHLLATAADGDAVLERFGCGVRSADSWPPALWAALRYQHDPEAALIEAVNLGGDADTIGAMTGALVGALHGTNWIPSRWFENLENGVNGRDEIIRAAGLLADLALSGHPEVQV